MIILQTCDVENSSKDTIVMEVKEKSLLSANYSVASNSNMTNCRNQTGKPVINMHYFSKDKTLPQKWIRFFRDHRKDFLPVKKRAWRFTHFDGTVVLIWWGRKSVKERVGFLFWCLVSPAQCLLNKLGMSFSGSAVCQWRSNAILRVLSLLLIHLTIWNTAVHQARVARSMVSANQR